MRSASRPRDSSRISQFFANFQSRITVSGEIFRTSAVSSTLNPPKKPQLDDLAFRSYCAASAASASSMAIRSSGVSAGDRQVLVERDAVQRAAALLVLAGPGEVHEHAPHQARGHREEVRAVLPLDAPDINQPEVDLVDERRGARRSGDFCRHSFLAPVNRPTLSEGLHTGCTPQRRPRGGRRPPPCHHGSHAGCCVDWRGDHPGYRPPPMTPMSGS